MLSYFLKCRKKTKKNINPGVSETRNGVTMLLWKCSICNSKKSRLKTRSKRNIKYFMS